MKSESASSPNTTTIKPKTNRLRNTRPQCRPRTRPSWSSLPSWCRRSSSSSTKNGQHRTMAHSDRQLDAFDNPAKMACREGNLRVLREAAFLLWEDSDRKRLRCDWCELMGETGLLTLDLLEREGVLAPGGFAGIDLD